MLVWVAEVLGWKALLYFPLDLDQLGRALGPPLQQTVHEPSQRDMSRESLSLVALGVQRPLCSVSAPSGLWSTACQSHGGWSGVHAASPFLHGTAYVSQLRLPSRSAAIFKVRAGHAGTVTKPVRQCLGQPLRETRLIVYAVFPPSHPWVRHGFGNSDRFCNLLDLVSHTLVVVFTSRLLRAAHDSSPSSAASVFRGRFFTTAR